MTAETSKKTREFHYSDSKSHKFWRISSTDASHTVQYGKIGTKGQTQTKEFSSEAEAQKSAEKLIQDKLRKGYVEVESEVGHDIQPRTIQDSTTEQSAEVKNSSSPISHEHDAVTTVASPLLNAAKMILTLN
ncbi:MAG: WGR domain-containing protein [Oscillatoriales cyanobacterium RM2_1_1]|nr:WGR domain-containing protein [Oscillatoriales cyanobacterium RM2_1_1]